MIATREAEIVNLKAHMEAQANEHEATLLKEHGEIEAALAGQVSDTQSRCRDLEARLADSGRLQEESQNANADLLVNLHLVQAQHVGAAKEASELRQQVGSVSDLNHNSNPRPRPIPSPSPRLPPRRRNRPSPNPDPNPNCNPNPIPNPNLKAFRQNPTLPGSIPRDLRLSKVDTLPSLFIFVCYGSSQVFSQSPTLLDSIPTDLCFPKIVNPNPDPNSNSNSNSNSNPDPRQQLDAKTGEASKLQVDIDLQNKAHEAAMVAKVGEVEGSLTAQLAVAQSQIRELELQVDEAGREFERSDGAATAAKADGERMAAQLDAAEAAGVNLRAQAAAKEREISRLQA